MLITITVDGVERRYAGDYDELHSKDWDAQVQELLDIAN